MPGATLDKISNAQLHVLLPFVSVFARCSPEQKGRLIKELSCMRQIGNPSQSDIGSAKRVESNVTLMVGDGTNDVGALKKAHVGISLLPSSSIDRKGSLKAPAASPHLRLDDDSISMQVRSID